MGKLFTVDKIAEALEKMFLSDRFVQWTGKETPELLNFVSHFIRFNVDRFGILTVHNDHGYYEIPVGSWLVKAPDDSVHAFGEGVRFVSNETKKLMDALQDEFGEIEIPITMHEEEKPITTFIPEDPFETEVVEEGNSISLRRKLDKDGNPILKKRCSESDKPNWMKRFVKEADKWTK